MGKYIKIIILTLFLTACVAQQALIKPTSSGYPEGIFTNTTVDSVRSKLIDACSSRGVLVQESSESQVICGKTLEGGNAAMAQTFVGNPYSTTPEQKIRFIIYKVGSDVKVTAQQWVETQMAFGQVRRAELKSNNQNNDIQQFLFSIGAQ